MSELLGIRADATWSWIPNEYDDIKEFIGNWIDLAGGHGPVSGFVDDEGVLNSLPFNVVASAALGRPIFGPVVLCHLHPDDEGETLPPEEGAARAFINLAEIWQNVLAQASRLGQNLTVLAQPETLPPPQMISLDDQQIKRWLFTGEVPLDE